MSTLSAELQYKINEYDLYRKNEKIFAEKTALQKKFAKDFPIKRIKQLKLDEYIVGKGSKDSFCYRIETGLIKLGNMKGATSTKFGIYYGKQGKDIEKKYRHTKKYGNSRKEAFENIKLSICNLLIAGKADNRDGIVKSKLAPIYRYKLLGSYFPDIYLNLYSDEHIDYFLSELGINNATHTIYDKQKVLLQFKNDHKILSTWSNIEFNPFLYKALGRPPVKKEEKQKLDSLPPIEKVKPEIINFDIINLRTGNQPINKRSRKKYKPNYEEQNDRNNRLGQRGENIVYNIEKEFYKKNNYSLKSLGHVSKKDDSLGYDIRSLDEDGKPKHIEVKSIRQKTGITNFIITANEKKKAEILDNYYIYIVFEAHTLHPKICQIKEPFKTHKDKMRLFPFRYRVELNIKNLI